MIESGSPNDNSSPLSFTDNQKKIKSLVSLLRKEQLDEENLSSAIRKQG
jgi:hypothetical protein